MNIKHALALIGAAAVSFAASAAPTPAPANTQDVAAVTVTAGATHSHYKPAYSEFQGVKGAYALADGRTLHVSGNNYHLYADVDGQKTEIMPVAPKVFASRDDGLRLTFDDSDFASDVKVSVPAR
jgi:hypothetical protein